MVRLTRHHFGLSENRDGGLGESRLEAQRRSGNNEFRCGLGNEDLGEGGGGAAREGSRGSWWQSEEERLLDEAALVWYLKCRDGSRYDCCLMTQALLI